MNNLRKAFNEMKLEKEELVEWQKKMMIKKKACHGPENFQDMVSGNIEYVEFLEDLTNEILNAGE